MMDFWKRVKDKILSENTTQAWVAKKTEKSLNTFKGWISKNILPDCLDAVMIAKALNTTVEELVDGETGRAYVLDWAERSGAKWKPSPRIAPLVADLLTMSADCLHVVGAMIRSAADLEREKGLIAAEPSPPAYNQ